MVDNIVIPSETAASIETWLGEWLFGGTMSVNDYADGSTEELHATVHEWLTDIIDSATPDDQDYILAQIVLEYIENVDVDWQRMWESWIDTDEDS